MPQRLQVNITEKEQYDEDLFRVRFGLDKPLDFVAGQFMSVAVDGFIRRSYSIANQPSENTYLETLVDCGPGGPGSKFFLNCKVGDEVDLLVPLGRFVYQKGHRPVIFFATGTGVVPFLSMIQHELDEVGSGRQMTLFYGVRSEDRVMVGDLLDRLSLENENFNYHLYVSKPKGSWSGNLGRFTQAIPEIDFTDTEIYICGGGQMIAEVEELAVEQGAEVDKIYYERYY